MHIDKLPDNPTDGQQIADEFGNIYQYIAAENNWRKIGIIDTPATVTELNNGIITPQLYSLLSTLLLDKHNTTLNKIATGHADHSYFYFVNSTDDLVRFSPEIAGNRRLRIELDRARLLQKIARTPCIGPVGSRGQKGLKGLSGIPADKEKTFTPIIDQNTITVSAVVTSPIFEPISLRIYQERLVLEFLIFIDGTDIFEMITNETDSEIKAEFSYDGFNLKGKIISDKQFTPGRWTFKARQRGPQGIGGNDGVNHLEVIDESIKDPLLRIGNPLNKMRLVQEKNIAFTNNTKRPDITVSSLNLTPSTAPATSVALSVEYEDDVKDIGSYKFGDCGIDIPELAISAWTPLAACADKRRYNLAPFKWFDGLTSGQNVCFTQAIPFSILLNPESPNISCKDEFFICPNKGDLCSFNINGDIVDTMLQGEENNSTGSDVSNIGS